MGVLSELAHDSVASGKELLKSAVRSASQATGSGAGSEHAFKISGSDVVLILLTLSVILRVINFHFFNLPSSVAIAIGSIVFTGFLGAFAVLPYFRNVLVVFQDFLRDFPDIVLHYMLGFLLFAAALEVKKQMLERIWSTVIALSVFSTAISTGVVSILTYLLMQRADSEMEFPYCLLFGAIVSPTDPVTVINIVNEKKDLLPKSTEYFVLGESLLNDAVGVVLYLVFKEIVQKPDIQSGEVVLLLLQKVVMECIGGAVIGIALAWVAYSAIKSIEDPLLEVMITFVLVGNINLICNWFHASIPLASVFAGLFVGNYGVEFAMVESNVSMFREIWKLADETLNSVLFLMIGAAELFWNPQALGFFRVIVIVVSIICISIFARAVSVALPLVTIIFIEWATGRRLRHPAVKYRGGTIAVLTWAGMRGGISIALALGIPDAFVVHAVPGHMTNGQLIFFMTFTLVVFSIIVQGLCFEPVVRAISRVSFRIMPSIGTSGGLGTFVSTTDFNQEPGLPVETPDGLDDVQVSAFEEDIYPWASGDEGRRSHDGNGVEPGVYPVLHGAVNGLSNSVPAFSDDISIPDRPIRNLARTRSLMDEPHRLSAIPSHVRTRQERTQGSATFANLRGLEEPITVNAFISESTKRFRSLFDPGRRPTDPGNYALRRSRTAPNNANWARMENESRMSQDDLAASLGSALRRRP